MSHASRPSWSLLTWTIEALSMNAPDVTQPKTPSPPGSQDASALGDPPLVPDYELISRIGIGAYGTVWLARSTLGTFRAVKVVARGSFERDQPFEREFKGIQRFEPISLTHESQVKILHVGRNEVAGYFYYVMELADDASRNPKSESRNPNEAQMPNDQTGRPSQPVLDSDFGNPSTFDLVHSKFYVPRTL